MTAIETIELAQGSVEQVQRGIDVVQDQLDKAEAFTQAASEVVYKARRLSRRAVICGGVIVVLGVAAIVIIKKRKRRTSNEESTETLT